MPSVVHGLAPVTADVKSGNVLQMVERIYDRRQRGSQWGPAPSYKIRAFQFHVWSPSYCIHPKFYFKNVPPLLRNSGGGPDRMAGGNIALLW